MSLIIVVAFILGYWLIAMEHPFKIDKAATALLTGVICWLILLFGLDTMPVYPELIHAQTDTTSYVHDSLFEHLGHIAEILFFLLGAMAIVELMDVHDAFRLITDKIVTKHRIKLLWIISIITFFLSAGLDNLTTSIIMCALLRRIIPTKEDMWMFGGFVIIAANSGGAWSPIGDVTTIMLWIGGQVTTINIIKSTLLASIFSLLVPLMVASFFMRRDNNEMDSLSPDELMPSSRITQFERNLLLFLGIVSLLFVPVFKTVTHLPPYMGILLSLGTLWLVTEILHKGKEPGIRKGFTVASILHRIDTPTILFFLGILLAVAALDSSGHLHQMADMLDQRFGNIYLINGMIGILSAIVDNVPLVAACMGMYDLSAFPPDHDFWKLLAYCAGTGGSILIIGSAAGVASMGILKIDFLWYLKKISFYALIGYLAGMAVYYFQHH